MRPEWRKVKKLAPHCPTCKEELVGNNSIASPCGSRAGTELIERTGAKRDERWWWLHVLRPQRLNVASASAGNGSTQWFTTNMARRSASTCFMAGVPKMEEMITLQGTRPMCATSVVARSAALSQPRRLEAVLDGLGNTLEARTGATALEAYDLAGMETKACLADLHAGIVSQSTYPHSFPQHRG